MKKILGFILMVVLAVAVYIPCREFAIMERGNTAYGGEVLVPVLVFLTYVIVADWFSEKEEACEVSANKGGTEQGFASHRQFLRPRRKLPKENAKSILASETKEQSTNGALKKEILHSAQNDITGVRK